MDVGGGVGGGGGVSGGVSRDVSAGGRYGCGLFVNGRESISARDCMTVRVCLH